MDNNELKSLFGELDNLLSKTDLSNVTSESAGFENLPDGYYLCEVTKAELKQSKTSKQPMVAFQLKTVDNGYSATFDENGETTLNSIDKTKNRTIFLYYVLKDERSIKRFVTDMLKFEGEKPGEPFLSKEYFTTSEVLTDALDLLVGLRIYVQISTTENDDETSSTWQNLVSWKRASMLELPM